MPKVCPVAAQVITFKNNKAVGPLLGVFILLQNICIITSILLLVSDTLALSSMLILVAVGIAVLNVCWFWWQLILQYQTYVGFGGGWYLFPSYVDFEICWSLAWIKICQWLSVMLINYLVQKIFMHFWLHCPIWEIIMHILFNNTIVHVCTW